MKFQRKINFRVVGIDATNLRGGGGITHLLELLRILQTEVHGFKRIVIWGSSATLRMLEDKPWLVKRNPSELDKGLIHRSLWQLLHLSQSAREAGCDVLFVPGGVPGTFTMMEDKEVLSFLAEKGQNARFVTSVCTGSLILGAAGLLNGYKATSHWATHDVLKELGAIPTKGRVVSDRNRITGGGVTAGIDFGLQIAANLRNQDYAEAIQLYLEYDPAPPFNAGSPEKAPAIVNQFLNDMFAGMRDTAFATAKRAKNALTKT